MYLPNVPRAAFCTVLASFRCPSASPPYPLGFADIHAPYNAHHANTTPQYHPPYPIADSHTSRTYIAGWNRLQLSPTSAFFGSPNPLPPSARHSANPRPPDQINLPRFTYYLIESSSGHSQQRPGKGGKATHCLPLPCQFRHHRLPRLPPLSLEASPVGTDYATIAAAPDSLITRLFYLQFFRRRAIISGADINIKKKTGPTNARNNGLFDREKRREGEKSPEE
ncbi:hypothetical protein GGS23DRAFT_91970 [Durotheca rogersii]|uniref:uncharacterized protein n=1 Tax=Durotheca rogersii TaxID=419775 RepID=UPI00221E514B|nr:uncharacterized protein GGS23DRAFT_91970 [Durotheca rogersii]KAI5862305.1 hypothetical protein GGS23DRAFT_91970 [Durotheca rogersii]